MKSRRVRKLNGRVAFVTLFMLFWSAPGAAEEARRMSVLADADCPLIDAGAALEPSGTRMGSSFRTDTSPPRLAASQVELSCSVVDWRMATLDPLLTLVCQTNKRSPRFRMYIQLSWMESGDRPEQNVEIVAPPKTPTRFRADASGAFVWLKVRGANGGKPRAAWVRFSRLVSLEMQTQD